MPASNTTRGKSLVLVVDDEPLIRMDAVDLIEEAAFATAEAGNADEALQILESGADIQILVTDIDMPAGSMNGLRLAATVKDRWPSIGIIVVSGRYSAIQAELPAGSVFLSKPYLPEALTGHLARFSG